MFTGIAFIDVVQLIEASFLKQTSLMRDIFTLQYVA